jgi:Xaa-Pro aminopeptidase
MTDPRPVTRDWFDNTPQLPLRERDRRWSAIRKAMADQGIDALLLIGNDLSFGLGMINIRYFSQVASRHGGFMIFPSEGEPTVYVGPPHMNMPMNPYAHAQDWVPDVQTNRGLDHTLAELRRKVSPLRRLGLVFGANRFQPDNIPHTVHAKILAALKDVEITDFSPVVFDLRLIKSEDEVAMLRRAGKTHEKVVQAMIDTAAPGVTEAAVYAAMIHEQIRLGGEAEIFNFFLSGPIDSPDRQHLLHGIDANISPTQRVLRNGDTIISESHCKCAGYMTQAEMTVAVGEPPAPYRRLFDAAVECFHAALPHLVPGKPIREALAAERAVLDKYGLDWCEIGFHGHGLGSPEDPTTIYMEDRDRTWPNGAEDTVLRENMVLATNIDIFDPAFRDDVGVMYCNTVLVRPQPEVLIRLPTELPVK